jgi:hypothetical protein
LVFKDLVELQVGNQVHWTIPTVSASSSLTVTFIVTVASPLPGITDITNTEYGVMCAEGVGASGDMVTTRADNRETDLFNTYLPVVLKNYSP